MSEIGNEPMFSSQCRVCMCFEPKMIGIFSPTATLDSISKFIMECVPVHIHMSDSLPHTICETCVEKLEFVYNFRTLCLNSDAAFRRHLDAVDNTTEMKIEESSKVYTNLTEPTERQVSFETKIEDTSEDFYEPVNHSTDSEDDDKPENTSKKKTKIKQSESIPKYKVRRVRGKAGPKKCPLFPDADGLYTCETCHKRYKRKQHLERHLISHTDFRFYCEICGREFVRVSNLQLHMKTHSDARSYSCEFCGVTFRTRNVLRNHRSIHLNLRPYSCDQCDKTFRQKKGLDNHLLTHTGERPFECSICAKRFNRKHHLATHAQIHVGRSFKCELCPQSFISKQNLHLHLLRH